MAVAVMLLGLCVSPVTAPFSTFFSYDLSHHAMSLTQKIAESLKTSDDDVIGMSAVGQVPEMSCHENAMAYLLIRLPGIGRELHVVLRI